MITISLRQRIFIPLAVLILVSVIGGIVMVWYTYKIENVFSTIVDHNIEAYHTAYLLENSLVNQKGFVSYYLLDRNPEWLRQLGEYRQIFSQQLVVAKNQAVSETERSTIGVIEKKYAEYISSKDQVIRYYMNGDDAAGQVLHSHVRTLFFNILSLCEKYRKIQKANVLQSRKKSDADTQKLRDIAGTAVIAEIVIGAFLAFILFGQILAPLNRLRERTHKKGDHDKTVNEIRSLSHNINDLIKDTGKVHLELRRSRKSLVQSEKMAMVGKLAAGMAHSIRNPLTSVKMRLFSLDRSLKLNNAQKEDFQVISEEIRQIDIIVQNFLEFSRPPKLMTQKISPSTVVDTVNHLMTHRLESYNVVLEIKRQQLFPETLIDPELLKEALVNIVENACQAMVRGGRIEVEEELFSDGPSRSYCLIKIRDNGPGLDDKKCEKIFQPFFTTKEEGTGLGLSIVERIIENHDGKITVESTLGQGTCFSIYLPIKEPDDEFYSGN